MFPNYLTVHRVACEAVLCQKSSKKPQEVPTLVISVKYPTVCMSRLCCFSLACLTLRGRWSPLPSLCRMTAACQCCAPSLTAPGCSKSASYWNNNSSVSCMQKVLCHSHSAGTQTRDANDVQSLPPDLLSAAYGGTETCHHTVIIPGLQAINNFLEFQSLWLRSMSLSGTVNVTQPKD